MLMLWTRRRSPRIVVPKGRKATIQATAGQEGSVNGYVGKAVLARMGLKEWPDKET